MWSFGKREGRKRDRRRRTQTALSTVDEAVHAFTFAARTLADAVLGGKERIEMVKDDSVEVGMGIGPGRPFGF